MFEFIKQWFVSNFKQTLTDKQKSILTKLDLHLATLSDTSVPNEMLELRYVAVEFTDTLRSEDHIMTQIRGQLPSDSLHGLYMPRSIAFLNTHGDWEFIIGVRGYQSPVNSIAAKLFIAQVGVTDKARLEVIEDETDED